MGRDFCNISNTPKFEVCSFGTKHLDLCHKGVPSSASPRAFPAPGAAQEGPVLALGADFSALPQDGSSDGSSSGYQQCVFAVLGLMMNMLLESNSTIQVGNIWGFKKNDGVAGYF